MAADALAYSVIVRELNSALKGGKITRIIQPEKDEIILTIYKDRKNFKLLLCTNSNVCRMHITEKPSPLLRPLPPSACSSENILTTRFLIP